MASLCVETSLLPSDYACLYHTDLQALEDDMSAALDDHEEKKKAARTMVQALKDAESRVKALQARRAVLIKQLDASMAAAQV